MLFHAHRSKVFMTIMFAQMCCICIHCLGFRSLYRSSKCLCAIKYSEISFGWGCKTFYVFIVHIETNHFHIFVLEIHFFFLHSFLLLMPVLSLRALRLQQKWNETERVQFSQFRCCRFFLIIIMLVSDMVTGGDFSWLTGSRELELQCEIQKRLQHFLEAVWSLLPINQWGADLRSEKWTLNLCNLSWFLSTDVTKIQT